MANRALFVGDKTPEPLGPSSDYDLDNQVLAAASYQVPAFWLFCFEEQHLCSCQEGAYIIPTAVVATAPACQLLTTRAGLADQLFPAHRRRWEEWQRLVRDCPYQFLKLEASEIWDMGPEDFGRHLPKAVRWFSSQDRADLESLFWLAGIEYDFTRRTIICKESDSPARYLQGYSWVREVPWDEDDLT